MYCSHYSFDGWGASSKGYYGDDGTFRYYFEQTSNVCEVYIHDEAYSDVAGFKVAMNGVQLVYRLAEPQIYQLPPTEVRTLYGENRIWADAGTVDMYYHADTKRYIDSVVVDLKTYIDSKLS